MAGAIGLPVFLALVARGAGHLFGLGVEHRVEDLLDLRGDEPVELGLELGLVDLYDLLLGMVPACFPIGFSFWRLKIVHRQGHVPYQIPKSKVRKISDTTTSSCQIWK